MERALLHRLLPPTPNHVPSVSIRVRPRPPSLSAGVLPLPMPPVQCSYLESINNDIDAHLEKAIPIKSPLAVFNPMRRLTFSAPRSTAPALCVAACELVGGDRLRAIPTAAALHILNAVSYFRDHLPLSDGPMSRLDPAIRHEFGPNIELLTGDGMVPLGIELIAGSDSQPPELTLRVIVEITRAIGSQGVIHGQYLERRCGGECEAKREEYVLEKKWGGMCGCAGACGAIVGGGGEAEIGKLRKVGALIGMLDGPLGRDELKMMERVKEKAVRELEEMGMGEVEVGPILSLVGEFDNNDLLTFA